MRKEHNILPPKFWTYQLADGWTALAGKTDSDNDALSLEIARPVELWFHVHAVPGSHVVLRAPEGSDDYEPTKELIHAAAAIAAFHSKARNAGMTPVDYCQARFVTKEPGAAPGSVMIRNSKTIKVRPEIPAANQP